MTKKKRKEKKKKRGFGEARGEAETIGNLDAMCKMWRARRLQSTPIML